MTTIILWSRSIFKSGKKVQHYRTLKLDFSLQNDELSCEEDCAGEQAGEHGLHLGGGQGQPSRHLTLGQVTPNQQTRLLGILLTYEIRGEKNSQITTIKIMILRGHNFCPVCLVHLLVTILLYIQYLATQYAYTHTVSGCSLFQVRVGLRLT